MLGGTPDPLGGESGQCVGLAPSSLLWLGRNFPSAPGKEVSPCQSYDDDDGQHLLGTDKPIKLCNIFG